MGDVERWLKALGLDRYSRVFVKHKIRPDTLRELTDQDLKELRIPIGHRKRILAAIRLLEKPKSGPKRGSEPAAVAPARDAERRVLTILYVDMVESTTIARHLDPEDLATLMNEFHEICRKVVGRFGGYVAKNFGDGLGAYFGWPECHELDAERAVLTALELIEAVKRIYTGDLDPIRVHVGIATGEVVVGDVPRMDSARVQEVFGELPSLAARLQAASPADTILISAETFELIQHKFVCADMGRKKLKGFQELTSVHRVIGPKELTLTFDARSAVGLTPFMDRVAELELMKTLWRQATAGNGQVIQLTGEPGIGKSRLCAELRLSLSGQTYSSLSFQCSMLHKDSPLHPVTRCIAQVASLTDNDPPEHKWRKLEALFGDGRAEDRESLSLLAAHLGIPIRNDGSTTALVLDSPERKRMALHRLISNFVINLARRSPALIIFEDIQWMDPTTGEFIEILITSIAEHPALIILTFRPGFMPAWTRCLQILVSLNRLNRTQTAQLINAFPSSARLPSDLVSELIERSDGNPLYIEELTAAVLGRRQLKSAVKTPERAGRGYSEIPSTLQETLFARIDQISLHARELLQICAVIGKRFAFEQLAAIAEQPPSQLHAALNELVSCGVLYQVDGGHLEYSFKHALIQDAAYAMILKDKRRRLHERCATALEARYGSIGERDPGMLGVHYDLAGRPSSAVPCFLAAGQLAIERSALTEANNYLRRGLGLLLSMPESESRMEEELKFRSVLGRVCIFSSGWADPSVKKEYEQALKLSKHLGKEKEQVTLEWALTTYHLLHGDIRSAVSGGERVLALAKRLDDVDSLHVAHSALTIYCFYAARFPAAIAHKDEALQFYRLQSKEDLQKAFGTDRGLQALRGASLSHWCLGNQQTAIDLDEEQRSKAVTGAHLFDHAYALTISCILHSLRRDGQTTYAYAEAAANIAQDRGFRFLEQNAANFRAIALALQDPCESTLADCDRALENYQAAGNRMGISAMLAIMGEVCGNIGLDARGSQYVDKGLEYVRRSGEHFAQADLYRVKGELMAKSSRLDDAERWFRRSLSLARKQRARTWELGAAIPLARMLLTRQRPREACRLLRPFGDPDQSAELLSDRRAALQVLSQSCKTDLARGGTAI